MQHTILDDLKARANSKMKEFYDGGKNLTGTQLKNYTSGDHQYLGFEKLLFSIVKDIIESVSTNKKISLSQEYFKHPENPDDFDNQRLDLHIFVDDKAKILIETRAWIDKPFYILKRAVVRNFMEADYVRKQLSDDVEFIFLALAIDILPKLKNTLDITQGYGNIVSTYKFSPKPRRQKNNYFSFGHDKDQVDAFVEKIYNKLVA